MKGSSYDARQVRVEAFLRRMGVPSSVDKGEAFDFWVYPDLVGPGIESLFSVGLSQYLLSGNGAKTVGYELHLIGEPGQGMFKDALFEAGDTFLERHIANRHAPTIGELLASDALKRSGMLASHGSLSALVTGWSVWLTENLVLDKGSDADGPLLFIDLTPVTAAEAELFRSERDRFEQLTSSARINLLNFRRSSNDQIAGA